jgi:hypothetical protein
MVLDDESDDAAESGEWHGRDSLARRYRHLGAACRAQDTCPRNREKSPARNTGVMLALLASP